MRDFENPKEFATTHCPLGGALYPVVELPFRNTSCQAIFGLVLVDPKGGLARFPGDMVAQMADPLGAPVPIGDAYHLNPQNRGG